MKWTLYLGSMNNPELIQDGIENDILTRAMELRRTVPPATAAKIDDRTRETIEQYRSLKDSLASIPVLTHNGMTGVVASSNKNRMALIRKQKSLGRKISDLQKQFDKFLRSIAAAEETRLEKLKRLEEFRAALLAGLPEEIQGGVAPVGVAPVEDSQSALVESH